MRVDAKPAATRAECEDFYKMHLQDFALPVRWRVSHLFLAAPPETPPDIVDLKRERIEGLAERLKSGENLANLIAAESEDEASTPREGDLGFFAGSRMPADFLRAAEQLAAREVSGPVQTTLGFHFIQGMERKRAEQLSFDQAREEIFSILARQRRLAALHKLDVDLASLIRFRPGISTARP
jgi:parvulin-like peptidyl-prolyl isomerase